MLLFQQAIECNEGVVGLAFVSNKNEVMCGATAMCCIIEERSSSGISFGVSTASQSGGLDSSAITYGIVTSQPMLGRLLGAIVLTLAVGFVCPADTIREGKQKRQQIQLPK